MNSFYLNYVWDIKINLITYNSLTNFSWSIVFQDLEQILKDSVKGNTVLFTYAFHGELDEKFRNILADIIVHYELKDDLDALGTKSFEIYIY